MQKIRGLLRVSDAVSAWIALNLFHFQRVISHGFGTGRGFSLSKGLYLVSTVMKRHSAMFAANALSLANGLAVLLSAFHVGQTGNSRPWIDRHVEVCEVRFPAIRVSSSCTMHFEIMFSMEAVGLRNFGTALNS